MDPNMQTNPGTNNPNQQINNQIQAKQPLDTNSRRPENQASSTSTQAPHNKSSFGKVTHAQPTPKASHYQKKTHLTSLGLIVLIIVCGFGVQKVYQKNKLTADISKVEQVIEAQKSNTIIQDNQEVSLGLKKAFLDKQKLNQIFWSNVLVRYKDLMKSNKNVSSSSFSGNQQGNLAFSAKTKIESNDPYLDTALLIERFKASNSFDEIFIPSISSTVSESGEETLSYNIRVDYLKNEIDQNLIEDINNNKAEKIEVDEAKVEELADELRGQTTPETVTLDTTTTDNETTEETTPETEADTNN